MRLHRLRQRIAKHLIDTGVRWYGQAEVAEKMQEMTLPELPEARARAHDAVVEASDDPVIWQPDQKGGVVVAEPLMMTKFRRGEIDE